MAFITRPSGTTVMPGYRVYTVGDDGHFIGFEQFVCASDDEAVDRAARFADRHDVELWSGPRLVKRVEPVLGLSADEADAVMDRLVDEKARPLKEK